MAKEHLEQWLWELAAAEIHHLHSDNGILNAQLFLRIVRTSSRLSHILELVLIIRMPLPSGQFKPS